MTITIITTTATFGVDGDRWTRDATGDLYVYSEDSKDPIAHVPAEQFVAALRTADAVDNVEDLADVDAGVSDHITEAVRDVLDERDT